MSIHDDVRFGIIKEVHREYAVRQGSVVPRSADVSSNQGVLLDATYLYADLADSSKLAQTANYVDAAKVIKTYVISAVRLIRHKDGHVRSFDGDRVMGIFIGDDHASRAARTALALNHYVNYMRLWIPEDLPSIKDSSWRLNHGVGIASGPALLVTAGIRNNGDLVSVGSAPNVAAKLSDIRGDDYSLHITGATWDAMDWETSYKASNDVDKYLDPICMWEVLGNFPIGGRSVKYLGSSYTWSYG